jgi:DNA-binding transcriptional LysR family regulator
MEIRVLEYYISIVNHKSITRAAEALHISQSTLSRQIMDMEDRLGVTLFERGRREISLTEDGDFLYQRAKEIVQLASDTEKKILAGKSLSGTIRIGIGEGSVNDLILSAVWPLIERNPDVVLDYQTLAADKIFRDIDMGLLDFGVVWTNDNLSRYEFLELPYENYWGAVIKSDDPLADK